MIKILLISLIFANPQEERWLDIEKGHTLAWARHKTGFNQDDNFKSVASIHGKSAKANGDIRQDDEVWVVVDRGDLGTFIEQFQALDWGTDSDYCWFVDSGIGDANSLGRAEVPEIPGVSGDGYTQYLIGVNPYSGAKIVAMGKDDSTLDTTWGDNGYWDAAPNHNPCRAMYQLSDGRLLVAHSNAKVSMIDTDGTTDTSWATSGTYATQSGVEVRAILEDNDGNFHFFGGVAASAAFNVYDKVDSDGTYIGGLTRGDTKIWVIYGVAWSDDTKTRIIAGGSGVDAVGVPPTHSFPDIRRPNLIAIDPTNYTIDTTWTGNVDGSPGFAQYPDGEGNQLAVYKIFAMSDGGIVLYRKNSDTLCKIESDGSAIDTTWGTSGIVDLGATSWPYDEGHTPTQDGDNLYAVTITTVGGSHSVFSLVDADGAITDTHDATGATYWSVTVFNDQLLFGNGGYIELWDNDFTYVSRFQVALTNIVWWVIPDETTYDPDIPEVPAIPGIEPNNVEGYDHLLGEEVCVYADGRPLGVFTVTEDANGTVVIDLGAEYDVVIAGINYYSIYESFPLELGNDTNIHNVTVDFYESLGCNVGVTFAASEDWLFSEDDFATRIDLVTEVKDAPFFWGTSREPVVYLWEWDPIPLCIRAIIPKLEVTYD